MAILEEHPIECKCDICSFQRCGYYEYPCDQCDDYSEYKPRSNADRIRAMTDEELADKVVCYIRCEACEKEFHIECDPLKTCRGIWLDWLKQEAADEKT